MKRNGGRRKEGTSEMLDGTLDPVRVGVAERLVKFSTNRFCFRLPLPTLEQCPEGH